MDEEWKEIPYFEGIYEASTWGRIRTVEGKVTIRADGRKRVWKQRILKLKKQKRHNGKEDKYDYIVTLWKDGIPNYFLVSRLIASTFIDDYLYSEMTVNHIDGNPSNNNVTNLEWLTRSENVKQGFDEGQFKNVMKSITLSDGENVINIESLSKADNFLGWKKGYTKTRLYRGYDVLISKSGVEYKIIDSSGGI